MATLFTDRQLYGQAIGCFYLVFVDLEDALRAAMKADKRARGWRRLPAPPFRLPLPACPSRPPLPNRPPALPCVQAWVRWRR